MAPHSGILAWKIPMVREAWQATVHGVAKSQTWLSDFHFQKNDKLAMFRYTMGFTGGSDSKEPTCRAGDLGLITGWEGSSRAGTGNSLQYSCLENPMDRGAWWATVHGVIKSWTGLSD